MTTATQISTGIVPKYRKVFFVDRNCELEADDKKALEEMGYLVVLVTGDPSRVVNAFIAEHY